MIQDLAGMHNEEMLRTFNMGIGMVLVVDADNKSAVAEDLKGEKAYGIGTVVPKEGWNMHQIEVFSKDRPRATGR